MSRAQRTSLAIDSILILGLLLPALTACDQQSGIEASLQAVQNRLEASNAVSDTAYHLEHDAEYPCQIRLREHWRDGQVEWEQLYRFDLTDIARDSFVQSKSGRRAIIYSGSRTSTDETGKLKQSKQFSELRINNLRFRGELSSEDQQQLIDGWNSAITACEEEYLLE